MPRFFFHMCDGEGFVEDEEGRELPSDDRARTAAVKDVRSLIATEVQKGSVNLASFIEVEDESRELLCTVTFSDALEITTHPCPRPPRD